MGFARALKRDMFSSMSRQPFFSFLNGRGSRFQLKVFVENFFECRFFEEIIEIQSESSKSTFFPF